MPRRPRQHEIGDRALNAVEGVVLSGGWIFRRQSESDYGIDAEVEAVGEGQATGLLAKLQIKGAEAPRWVGGRTFVVIRTDTLRSWANVALPVLVALHDQAMDRVYVAVPPTQIPNGASVRVYVDAANFLDESLTTLKQPMLGWYSGYGEHTIAEIPAFGRIFDRLVEAAEFDFFMPADPEIDDELRLFYRHLFRLVLRARQPVTVLPSLRWWYAIDGTFWPDDDRFHFGTLDLFVRFVSPIYRAAREQIAASELATGARYADREYRAAAEYLESSALLDFHQTPEQVMQEIERRLHEAGVEQR